MLEEIRSRIRGVESGEWGAGSSTLREVCGSTLGEVCESTLREVCGSTLREVCESRLPLAPAPLPHSLTPSAPITRTHEERLHPSTLEAAAVHSGGHRQHALQQYKVSRGPAAAIVAPESHSQHRGRADDGQDAWDVRCLRPQAHRGRWVSDSVGRR
eukprot:362304-Chlamydomonas_euryale.AAC.1